MVACLKFTIHSAPETNKLGANIYLAPFMRLHRSLTHYTCIHTDIYTYVYYIYIYVQFMNLVAFGFMKTTHM